MLASTKPWKSLWGCLGVGLLILSPAAARAADSVYTTTDTKPIKGTAEISQREVTIRNGVQNKSVPVNEITRIVFDGEPSTLDKARDDANKGEFDSMMQRLNRMQADKITRPEIKADYEFYKAMATTRLAIGGEGSKAEAGKLLLAFEKAYDQSYHYFENCELIGDLFVALNKHEQAAAYYSKLAESPWPDMQMHGKVLLAQSLVGQKKYKEAISKFDDVLAASADNKQAEQEKQSAALGRAAAMAATGKVEESIKAILKMIEAAPSDDDQFYARAYNALGACYQLAGKNKEALLAYLHTNLLYSQYPTEDAEALAALSRLWTDVNQGNRGANALRTLKEKYPYSAAAQGK